MVPHSSSPEEAHSLEQDNILPEQPKQRLIILPRSDKSEEPHRSGHPEIVIPKIKSLVPEELLSSRARGLVGKFVDEFGNVLDWDGTVLGSIEGDLPSMVGRPVSESGEVFDSSGEVAGWVSENHANPPLKDLQGGLKVDESGTIYNKEGIVIGKIHDPSFYASEGSGWTAAEQKNTGRSTSPRNSDDTAKQSPAKPSPSEVYLDIKSTHDGIQLIIKIPTVLEREK